MKILSWNVNRASVEETDKLIDKKIADIYCFQECKYGISGREIINTANLMGGECLAKEGKIGEKWEELIPWIEYPENYFVESIVKTQNSPFVLINVHLAGFYSNKRYPLMAALLKRLKDDDLKNMNVILLGDFNAQTVHGNSTLLQRQGSQYLEIIKNMGFVEAFKSSENPKNPEKTYVEKGGHRFDHVFVRKQASSVFEVSVEEYISNDNNEFGVISDHKGILISVNDNI